MSRVARCCATSRARRIRTGPTRCRAGCAKDDTTIIAAARLLRRYHDVASTFVAPRDARWRTVAPGPHEVICHYDWAPYNAVFRDREPVYMLDWDSAGPGTRLWDVAISAYSWVPLFPSQQGDSSRRVLPLQRRAARLATYCAAYGGIVPGDAIDALVDELPFHADLIQQLSDRGDPGVAKLIGWDVPARLRRESQLLRDQRAALVNAQT